MYQNVEKRLERKGWIARHERAEQRAPELQAYWVEHEGVSNEEVDAFKSLLQEATKEEEIQQFFKKHPTLLLQGIIGHRGCVCIPKQKLNRKVTDFLIAWVDSMGFWWLGVELENPRAQMFTERGDPTRNSPSQVTLKPGESETYHVSWEYDASQTSKEELDRLVGLTTILATYTTPEGSQPVELLFPDAPYPSKTPPKSPPG